MMLKVFTAVIAISIILIYFFKFDSVNQSAQQYNSLLKESNRTSLDLRKIDTVKWDELVFWPPYSNICDFGISGYEKDGANCELSTDDGECYLLLLYSNKLAAKIPVNRQLADFTKTNFKDRVSKSRAVFKFASKGDWPAMILFDEQ